MSIMSNRSIEVRHDTVSREPNSTNVIKFGITTPLRVADKGELILLRPEQTLEDAVAQVCTTWGFPDPSVFALRFTEPPGHYVTENTKKELNGKIGQMIHSPTKISTEIIEKLKSVTIVEVEDGLRSLSEKSSDPTLADVFVENGLPVLVDLIEKEKLADRDKGLANLLQVLLDIMMHSSNATWDKIQPPVISKVAGYINNQRGVSSNEKSPLGAALQVLESAVSSGVAYSQVEKEVTLPNLLHHVQNNDPSVQQSALSLVNALLSKSEKQKRKQLVATFNSRHYRDIVLQHVIKRPGDVRPSETNHQLYVMQTLFLNVLEEKKLTPVDPQDQEALTKIKELCRIAFESDVGSLTGGSSFDLNSTGTGRREKPNYSRDYKKLGFQNDINPALDFVSVPGSLALDCIYYLADSHTETYSKIVLESSCRSTGDECPFARAFISLVTVLCDILKIGEPPGDQQGKFYPFFFHHERPFEELFCVCAQLVTKTWKEMRATAEDFDKVFDVVREQIRRALDTAPETFESLRNTLQQLTFAEITNLRAQERTNREEGELQAKPIQELRSKLEAEMKELIKQNRINYLISGTRFNKFALKGLRLKEKFWFCRLSPNAKVFHYGECEEKATPTPEELSSKVTVVELIDLYTGKDCPHIKDKRKNAPLAFSLVMEKEPLQTLDFVAPDDKTFDLWTDGINALLGKPMTSKEANNDLEVLLHMEIKLRLLDIEGVEIPSEAPPIPEPPPNYDFTWLK